MFKKTARTMLRRRWGTAAVGAVISSAVAAAMLLAGAPAKSFAQSTGDKIVVGAVTASADKIPFFIAIEEGFFKKAGLDVEFQQLSGGNPAGFAALSSGSVHVLIAGSLDYIQATSRKVVDARMFGEVVDSSTDLVAKKEITSVDQLKGKTIGVSGIGAGDYLYIRAILVKSGISPNDNTFAVAGSPTTRLASLAAGKIDVTAQGDSNREQSEQIANVLVKSSASPLIVPNVMIGALASYIAAHKSELQKMLVALGEAVDWVKANRAKAVPACMKMSGADEATCKRTIENNFSSDVSKYTWSTTFAVNVDGIKGAMEVFAQDDPAILNLPISDVADLSIASPPK